MSIDFRICFCNIVNISNICDIGKFYRIKTFDPHIQQHKILHFFNIRDFVTYTDHYFSAAVAYISRRHREILCTEDRRNIGHRQYSCKVCAVYCCILLRLHLRKCTLKLSNRRLQHRRSTCQFRHLIAQRR